MTPHDQARSGRHCGGGRRCEVTNEPFRVWITQSALSTGITEATATSCTDSPKLIELCGDEHRFYRYRHSPHWHRTERAAVERALAMIEAKRTSVAKTLAKLDKLEAQYRVRLGALAGVEPKERP